MAIIRVTGFDRNRQAMRWIEQYPGRVVYSQDLIYEWHYGLENRGNPYTQYREYMFENERDALEFALLYGN